MFADPGILPSAWRWAGRRTWRWVIALVCCAWLGTTTPAAAEETPAERRARIASMSPAELDALRERKERFEKFSPEKQQQLRELHAAIERNSRADRLRRILDRYNQWLETLSATERAELRKLDAKQRVARAKKIMADKQREESERLTRDIPFEKPHFDAINKWLDDYVKRHKEQMMEELPLEKFPQDFADKLREGRDSPFDRMILLYTWRRSGGEDRFLANQPEDLTRLVQVLPQQAQDVLGNIDSLQQPKEPASKLALKVKQIDRWIHASFAGKRLPFGPGRWHHPWKGRPQSPPSDEQLDRFLKERVSQEDRERLTKLPGDEFRKQLVEHYWRDQWRRKFSGHHGSSRTGKQYPFGRGDGRGRDGPRGSRRDGRGDDDPSNGPQRRDSTRDRGKTGGPRRPPPPDDLPPGSAAR